jgi:hypothetical protein
MNTYTLNFVRTSKNRKAFLNNLINATKELIELEKKKFSPYEHFEEKKKAMKALDGMYCHTKSADRIVVENYDFQQPNILSNQETLDKCNELIARWSPDEIPESKYITQLPMLFVSEWKRVQGQSFLSDCEICHWEHTFYFSSFMNIIKKFATGKEITKKAVEKIICKVLNITSEWCVKYFAAGEASKKIIYDDVKAHSLFLHEIFHEYSKMSSDDVLMIEMH